MRMTRTARIVIAAGLALGGVAYLHAQTPPGPIPREPAFAQTVSVTGLGRVNLTPDRAMFTAGVQTVAPTLAAATQENGTRMTAILSALKAAGAAERDLRTTGLSIYPQQAQQGEGRPLRIVAYQVSNSVTVTKDEPSAVGRLLEAAVNAGANSVSGIQFTVSDPTRGRDTGLQAAFADAKAKAELLARAAGRSIGRALAITEGGAPHQMPVPMMRMRNQEMAMAASVPVESGTEDITFTVSVMFELQ
jgi:uncharacterized protein YggE